MSAFGGPASGTVVVWQWTNDEGDWSLYDAQVSNYIEDCYSSSRGVVRLGDADRKLGHLTVDIRQMVQKSFSGTERPIRRELCDGNSAIARGAIWQWGKERTHHNVRQYSWLSYSMDAANMLEAAFSSGAKGYVDLDVSPVNEPYVVDLNTMQQINKSSGFCRPVQRLRSSCSYRTVSSVRQSWHQGSGPAPGPSIALTSRGFGQSTQSLYVPAQVTLSNANFLGGGMQSASNGANFNFGNNSLSSGGAQSGAGAPGTAPGPGFSFGAPIPVGQPSSGAGFSFGAPIPVGQPSSGVGFSFGAPPPVGQPSFAVPLPVPPMRRHAKRVRTLRQNLTPGAGMGMMGPPQIFPSGAQPSSSNWPANAVPTFGMQQNAAPNSNANFGNLTQNLASSQWSLASNASHGSNASSFSSWRNVPSQPTNGNNSAGSNSFGQSRPLPQSVVSGGSGSGGSKNSAGNNSSGQGQPLTQSVVSSGSSSSNSGTSSSIISSLITGVSKLLTGPYRYITTGGQSSQSGSSNASNVPAQSVDTVTPSTSKLGARSKGSSGQNTKRRKFTGEDQIMQDDLSLVQKLTARDVLRNYIIEVPRPPKKEVCCICCDSLREASGYGQGDSYAVVRLMKCQHMFHMDCLSAMYDSSNKNGSVQCPNCKVIYGTKYGNCPNGVMMYTILSKELSGFPGTSTFEIQYHIHPGLQSDVHPNPGRPYTIRGFPRVCYLPNNQEGQRVLDLLVIAWKRRLTFTIGTSVTTGEPDVVVWNEIHHKTEMDNTHGHGYPDPNYLSNVLAELASQGVTDDDDDSQ